VGIESKKKVKDAQVVDSAVKENGPKPWKREADVHARYMKKENGTTVERFLSGWLLSGTLNFDDVTSAYAAESGKGKNGRMPPRFGTAVPLSG